MAEEVDVELVDDEWKASVEEDPAMKLQLWGVRDLLLLLVNRDWLVKFGMVYVQVLEKPVAGIPL